jgi:hypothetical protein
MCPTPPCPQIQGQQQTPGPVLISQCPREARAVISSQNWLLEDPGFCSSCAQKVLFDLELMGLLLSLLPPRRNERMLQMEWLTHFIDRGDGIFRTDGFMHPKST